MESDVELKLSVKERALKVFSNIEGLDDIKEMMLRALESLERAHTLLIGQRFLKPDITIIYQLKSIPGYS